MSEPMSEKRLSYLWSHARKIIGLGSAHRCDGPYLAEACAEIQRLKGELAQAKAERIAELEKPAPCSVCAGEPKFSSVAPGCICEGEGTLAGELVGLRKERRASRERIVELESRGERLRMLLAEQIGPDMGPDDASREAYAKELRTNEERISELEVEVARLEEEREEYFDQLRERRRRC